jgi:ribonuclease HI
VFLGAAHPPIKTRTAFKNPQNMKYYVVWKGRKTGVFTNWDETKALVDGFYGAQYKAFESRAAAEAALKGSFGDYKAKPALRQSALVAAAYITESWSVDAACSGNPGVLEYKCVHTGTGENIFHQGPFANGTNNIGEFLAVVEALQLLHQRLSHLSVYTDSVNAMLWVKARKCRTKLAPNGRNAPLFERIARAEAWLASNTYPNMIIKWDTAAWGEIPADFGRK